MKVIGWEMECLCLHLVETHLNKPGKYLLSSFASATVYVHIVSFGTVSSPLHLKHSSMYGAWNKKHTALSLCLP